MAQPRSSVCHAVLQRLSDSDSDRPPPAAPKQPPPSLPLSSSSSSSQQSPRSLLASIPRTSDRRLDRATPHPSALPSEPIRASSAAAARLFSSSNPSTVLYLAYGSNLCSETFLGRRGIRPLSQINVSAPTLRLTFDLAGMPYREPCFANTAPRKLPDKPPELPPGLPDPPKLPDPPEFPPRTAGAATTSHGDPEWTRGLVGVVYEVTRQDYSHIVATEGGGASYHDILVPCIEIPTPRVGVPEKPPVPEPPRPPFMAHTLYAPRLPDLGDDDDNDNNPETPKVPRWAARFLRPVRRPDPEYAQPSARYLKLLVDGAAEHNLPEDYQAWLASLAAYRITSRRQNIGRIILELFYAPLLLVIMGLSKFLTDEDGRVPLWYGVLMGAMFNMVWTVYDVVFKPVFGDGERTEEADEGDRRSGGLRAWWRRMRLARRKTTTMTADGRAVVLGHGDEKTCLLG